MKISPTGKYLAVATPDGEQTGIAILEISKYPKLELVGGYKFSPFEHIAQIYWANAERVLFTTARQQGTLNVPQPTGRLYAMNADGKNRLLLYGTTQDYIKFVGRGAQILSMLRDDPEHILLATYASDRPRPFVEKVDVNNGRKDIVASSPLDNGSIHVDHNDVARFAVSVDDDLNRRIAYRKTEDSDWIEKDVEWDDQLNVVGFTEDNSSVLIQTNSSNAMGLHVLDPMTLEHDALLTSNTVEAQSLIRDLDDRDIVGAVFEDGIPENRFLSEDNRTARLYRLLEKAFPHTKITVTSVTDDGRKAVLAVQNDRLPADYFMFDTEELKADFLVSARPWLDPNALAARKPISFKASDGVQLYGYLTTPPGMEAKNLPLVTIVHGGPHGPRHSWLFDYEAQLFANRGYAVLQVNFRGSGGYGKDFESSGYTRWGTRIQDDVMDGVKWTIDQGIADKDRMCVYGGSFGGYSAAQQLIRFPETWSCGIAVAGVYDLELLFEEGDIAESEQGLSMMRRYLSTDEELLKSMSPVHHVDKIKKPLFVAHGTEDVRAHIEHYRQFIAALDAADVDHEELLIENEGHGFYKLENRRKFYGEVLDFLDEHIGD